MNNDNNWQDNTKDNPFWKDSETHHGGPVKAVEVMFEDGRTTVYPCPKCVKAMFPMIKKWRRVGYTISTKP